MTDEEQRKIFSKNLNFYVANSGKQQKEIAEALGFNQKTFNGWCNGLSIPKTGKIQALADYFGIRKSDLLDDKWQRVCYTALRGETMFELGQFIKKKRESAGLSQKTLGEAAGISDSEVQRIESGARKKPSWETLCKIAKALDFHPFEILQHAGYITVDDLKPYSQPVKGLGELNPVELKYVQLFADFIKANRQSDEKQ